MEFLCFKESHFLNGIPRIVFYFYAYEEVMVENIWKADHMEK
jgi:hypothetical protein